MVALRTSIARAVGIAVLALSGASWAGPVTLSPVALSGVTPVPTVGGTFPVVYGGGINENGTVLLAGQVDPSDYAYYTVNGSTFNEIARMGATVLPGTGGQIADNLGSATLNANGDVAFTAYYGASYLGSFTDIGGTLASVALTSSGTVPGSPANAFTGFEGPAFNASGQVAFRASYGSSSQGFFTNAGGTLAGVALSDGAPVPNEPSVQFTGFGIETINAAGRVAFNAFQSDSSSGIYISDNGGPLAAVAQTGITTDPVSGLPLLLAPVPTLCANGDVVFSSYTFNGSSIVNAIYRYNSSGLSRVVVDGQAAPGTSSTFSDVSQGTADANGNVVFPAFYNSNNDIGIFSTVGGLHAVALSSSGNAPGASMPFYNFGSIDVSPTTGQVAFIGYLDNTYSNYGLWVTDPVTGLPVPIAITGDPFSFSGGPGGPFKTVSDVLMPNNLAGEGNDQGLTDNGTFVFTVEFTDGTYGVYTGDFSVPEPASLGVLGLGAALLLARKKSSGPRSARNS